MLLASQGYRVEVFEKQHYVGGRTSSFSADGFTFDLGPTFLMMKYVLEEIFRLAGRSLGDHLTLRRVDPLYRLVFRNGKTFLPRADEAETRAEISRVFPGNESGYDSLMRYEAKKCARLLPCLSMQYEKWRHLLRKELLLALPYLDGHVSLHKHLSRFLDDQDLVIAFTFQGKYLGVSPRDWPGLFSILSHIEHAQGI
jgi:phytoene desaturase